jgi:hypothetical protein
METIKNNFEKWFKREWPDAELHWTSDNWCYCVYTTLDPQPLWECWQTASAQFNALPEKWRKLAAQNDTKGEAAFYVAVAQRACASDLESLTAISEVSHI